MKWTTIEPISEEEYTMLVKSIPSYVNRIQMEDWKTRHSARYSTWTLGSILGSHCQRHSKKVHWTITSPESAKEIYQTFEVLLNTRPNKGFLLELAYTKNLAPTLVARLILENYLAKLKEESKEETVELGVTECLKYPARIPNTRLAEEILLATLDDDEYGPYTETIKQQVGVDFENMLKRMLRERDLPFIDEEQMRKEGYDKTPDVKLEVPIAVDGCIINWIESKALFGDRENHETYSQNQFLSYWNRFGPGMVIYWFGFIDNLDTKRDKGVMLTTDFPKEYTTLPLYHKTDT